MRPHTARHDAQILTPEAWPHRPGPTEAVAEEYGLTRDDVLAALAYAAHTLAVEEVRAVS